MIRSCSRAQLDPAAAAEIASSGAVILCPIGFAPRIGGLLGIAVLLVVVSALAPASVVAGGGDDHRAALVVRYASGQVETHCVSFAEPSITGEQLLARSGLAVTMDYNAGLGGAVCRLNDAGCDYPKQGCFCRCMGAQCEYWAYYLWNDGGWHYSRQGASSVSATDGALQGWSWGPGNFASGTEPPAITFADICDGRSKAAAGGESVLPATGVSQTSSGMLDAGRAAGPSLSQYAAFGAMAGLLLAIGAVGLARRKLHTSGSSFEHVEQP